jgi:hypothetical protein
VQVERRQAGVGLQQGTQLADGGLVCSAFSKSMYGAVYVRAVSTCSLHAATAAEAAAAVLAAHEATASSSL